MRDGARGHGLPAPLRERHTASSLPRHVGARLTARVGELHPATAPWLSTKRATRAQASAWASSQMPASAGEIRPSGSTALASVSTSEAPPTARLPRWTSCHSFGNPATDEYWHIGETMIRFLSVTDRCVSGLKRITGPCNNVRACCALPVRRHAGLEREAATAPGPRVIEADGDQPRPAPGSLVSRCASATGIRLTTITTSAIAFTIGRFCPCRMKPKRSSGRVFCAPAVK